MPLETRLLFYCILVLFFEGVPIRWITTDISIPFVRVVINHAQDLSLVLLFLLLQPIHSRRSISLLSPSIDKRTPRKLVGLLAKINPGKSGALELDICSATRIVSNYPQKILESMHLVESRYIGCLFEV